MGFPVSFPWVFPSGDYEPALSPFGDLEWDGTHAASAVDLLLEQFKGMPLVEGYVTAYANRCQELENAIWDVLTASDLDIATNAQLNGIGALVGEGRGNRTDAEYRAAIRVRILINRCNGRHSEMLRILMLYLGASSGDGSLRLKQTAPCALSLQVLTVPSVPDDLRTKVYAIKPAGVNLDGAYATDADQSYRFGWSGGAIAGVSGGVNGDAWSGDPDPSDPIAGGYLAARI